MGKSAPSAPAAPDPEKTSAAQTQSNKETALYTFGLNNPNVNSPLGNLSYTIDQSDPNAARTTQNITLSPETQQLLNQYQQNTTQQGATAGTALNNVTNLFNTPYDLAGNVSATPSQQDLKQNLDDTRNALYSQQTQYLDPQFQQSQDQLNSGLANQGLAVGSKAYQTAQDNLARQKQQAYQSARESAIAGGTAAQAQEANTGLANQAQQAQMYTQQYQNPLSLYNSLITGTQPNMPQFQGTNQSNVAPTDVQGAYNRQYQGQLNQYNAQVGAQNSMTSGLFSLGGAALPLIFSDRRLKKNIVRIGELKNKIPLYEFSYIWDDVKRQGVMADEVLQVAPDAVFMHESGYMMVNYGALDG